MNGAKEFCLQLKQGPAFLLLGQDYLKLETGKNPFLLGILRKYGEYGPGDSYDEVFQSTVATEGDNAVAWMDSLCDSLAAPQWLETVSFYPWSGVFSSSIEDIWLRAFRIPWRDIQSIYEDKYKFHDIRSRTHLNCVFLYGSVAGAEEDQMPPLSKMAKTKRKPIATALLNRLPDLVSPFGTLVIEGYAGNRDWVSPEDLYPIVDSLGVNQVHMFSADQVLLQDEYIQYLIQNKKLVLHAESLHQFLGYGYQTGYLERGQQEITDKGYFIYIKGEPYEVPVDMFNQITNSATILDATKFTELPHLSHERLYQEFKRFLGESSYHPIWDGYARGFSFTREFETTLTNNVKIRLNIKDLDKNSLIIHGQTGTGKTMALGALAYNLAKEKQLPVVFIEKKITRPNFKSIDNYIKWCEDKGANKTLVIWDGMLDLETYEELRRFLTNQGRKVVLIGSCYRNTDQITSRQPNYIEAPAVLNSIEREEFNLFLGKIDPELINILRSFLVDEDDEFLVALYRLLPDSRSQIKKGIMQEIHQEENRLRTLLDKTDKQLPTGTLALALLKAGLINTDLGCQISREADGQQLDYASRLVGFVMVPGQFGLRVPIEILLRVINKSVGIELIKKLAKRDLFRWSDDNIGNIYIVARSSFEAQVFLQYQFGGIRAEVSFAKELICNVAEHDWQINNPEIQFAVDLIRSMGPRNKKSRYISCYMEIAEALSYLRQNRGIYNPRLMLQEASLMREWVQLESNNGNVPSDAEYVLSNAEDIMKKATTILDESQHKSIELKVFCLVELAAIIGARIINIIKLKNDSMAQIVGLYKNCRSYLSEARALYPENYPAYDVGLWTAQAILGLASLKEADRLELEGDIRYTIEIAESQGDIINYNVDFNDRKNKLNGILSDKITDEAFENLLKLKSSAGIYFRTQQIIKEIPRSAPLDFEQICICKVALDYLEAFSTLTVFDERCLWLRLNLWWKVKVGKPLFWGERQTLAFEKEDWEELMTLLGYMIANPDFQQKPSILYLKGIALFHLNRFAEAKASFMQIERDFGKTPFDRRIYRNYLMSNPDGYPRLFNGMVKSINNKTGRIGTIRVDDLRIEIVFMVGDFKRTNIQIGDTINRFHIAFNYIGANADPVAFYNVTGRK